MRGTEATPVWRRGGTAVAGAAVLVTAAAIGPAVASMALHVRSDLRDFAPATAGPFDGARASLTLVEGHDQSVAVLVVKGIDPAVAGRTFGAHLHTGPCVTGDPAAAGPHYNHSGVVPPVVNDQTEVWLDFRATTGGTGQAVAHVPWEPGGGQHSVVIHENPTAPNGTAGARLACLPVEW
jgi:Cu/Zn superoxide dismutase